MFIDEPTEDAAVAALYRSDLDEGGYVMNLTRLWAWRPSVSDSFVAARKELLSVTTLSHRERAVLVCATARSLRDSYCSLAWGTELASLVTDKVAAELLATGVSEGLSERESALAEWAQKVVTGPNEITVQDVSRLKEAGFSDQQVFDATVFIAFRQAFSTVNDALGARPDYQLWSAAPTTVRDAVTYGRSRA